MIIDGQIARHRRASLCAIQLNAMIGVGSGCIHIGGKGGATPQSQRQISRVRAIGKIAAHFGKNAVKLNAIGEFAITARATSAGNRAG